MKNFCFWNAQGKLVCNTEAIESYANTVQSTNTSQPTRVVISAQPAQKSLVTLATQKPSTVPTAQVVVSKPMVSSTPQAASKPVVSSTPQVVSKPPVVVPSKPVSVSVTAQPPKVVPTDYTRIVEGASVRCQRDIGTSKEAPIYRYTSGQYRLYPNDAIAKSWNPNWKTDVKTIDCSIRQGSPMEMKPMNGSTVQCTQDGKYYRFESDELKLYPTPEVANTWNPDWKTNVNSMDCSSLKKGQPLSWKPKPLPPNGSTIQCYQDKGSNINYRLENGQYRMYPNRDVAKAWNPTWDKTIETVDCSGLKKGDPMSFKPKLEAQWTCKEFMPQYFTPARVNANGDAECMSEDNKGCWWMDDMNYCKWAIENPVPYVRPLVCGEMHASIYGDTGYETQDHWCSVTRSTMTIDDASQPKAPQLSEGATIQCYQDKGYGQKYRYANNQYRLYPDADVAKTWNPDWTKNIQTVDCSSLQQGPPLSWKPEPLPANGSTIQCYQDKDSGANYRLDNGQYRLYPDADVASSWNPNWEASIRRVDCSTLQRGPDMSVKPPPTDGQTVKCYHEQGTDSQNNIYRFTDGKYRMYPNERVAKSWNADAKSAEMIDCMRFERSDDMSLKPQPTPWICLDNISAPVRQNTSGDIECMSQNGKDCMWKSSTKNECSALLQNTPENIQPLACGEMHKEKYGVTGYDDAAHWCALARTFIDPALEIGTSIKCLQDRDTPKQWNVYRVTENKEYRKYPSPQIAASWRSDWDQNIKTIDCAPWQQGPDMDFMK